MKYDVLVAGGGASGCSAAYNLAKNGLKVLLIEKNSYLGGLMTGGLVTPMMKTSENSINNDFFNLVLDKLKELGGQFTFPDNKNKGWFNPELMKIVLDDILINSGVKILFNSEIDNINIKNDSACINLKTNLLSVYIETKYVIDATGNSEISKKLNCDFIEENETQPYSLRFIMSGIDLKVFSKWLSDTDSDKVVTPVVKEGDNIHLSTAYTWDKDKKWALAPLFEDAVNKNILKSSDCNYFQIFTVPGMPNSIAFNAPRIVSEGVNDDDDDIVSKALIEGRKSILRLTEFCKIYFPGFEKAYISNIADMLGVRVSKRPRGKYIYTIDDILNHKKFENKAVVSDYPIDIHSAVKDKSLLKEVKGDYELPVEALISEKYDNLFTIGRGVSADFYSQGALRIIPSCFSMGEAIAKYILNLQ